MKNWFNWFITHAQEFIIAIFGIIAPVQEFLLTILFLILVDFIFGVMRAFKLKETKPSWKWRRTISKGAVYALAVISVYVMDIYIMKTNLNLCKFVAAFIGLVELKSILENFEGITGINIWDNMIKFFKNTANSDIIDSINGEDKEEEK